MSDFAPSSEPRKKLVQDWTSVGSVVPGSPATGISLPDPAEVDFAEVWVRGEVTGTGTANLRFWVNGNTTVSYYWRRSDGVIGNKPHIPLGDIDSSYDTNAMVFGCTPNPDPAPTFTRIRNGYLNSGDGFSRAYLKSAEDPVTTVSFGAVNETIDNLEYRTVSVSDPS